MTIKDSAVFLKHLSIRPGVYRMLDARGKVLYVGKARNLQKRVSSYFQRSLNNKTQTLMEKVQSIETTITHDENEALLLEANLIKEHQPHYNVLLRDDKSYPYLYLSTHQKFPRLDFYRGAKKAPGRYFGPYPNAGSVRENLALIQKLFKLRQCSDDFFKSRTRPCLQYQIKRCTAPCVDLVDEESYRLQVQDAILFLEGKSDSVITQLIARMEEASQKLEYETASYYRDQISQLRRLQKQQIIVGDSGDVDVLGTAHSMGSIAITVLFIRSGRIIGDKTFFPNLPPETTDAEALSSFIPQYYLSPLRNGDIPSRIIVGLSVPDRAWVQKALALTLKKNIKIIEQGRALSKRWVHMACLNAEQALAQHLAVRQTVTIKLEELQKYLKLPNSIQRIECFDVSHLMGEATVASCVVFGSEGPVKKDYRRYNITGVTPGDDYGALKQALMRRYTRLKENEGVLPDILMIDGGIGQLKQAAKVLEELQVSGVMVMSIAKGPERKSGLEKIYLWGQKLAIDIPNDTAAFHLIQFIRDEAHRFAITAHRAKRSKRSIESPLQAIAGIGPKRRRQLLRHFGGLIELKRANVQEIARVPGISLKLAQQIHDALRR